MSGIECADFAAWRFRVVRKSNGDHMLESSCRRDSMDTPCWESIDAPLCRSNEVACAQLMGLLALAIAKEKL